MRRGARRRVESRVLRLFFALFVVFMYGPIIAVVILSFQGVDGGLTFPMNGVSVHWFGKLFEKQMVGDFEASFARSFTLALVVIGVAGVVLHRHLLDPHQRHRHPVIGVLVKCLNRRLAVLLRVLLHQHGIAVAPSHPATYPDW